MNAHGNGRGRRQAQRGGGAREGELAIRVWLRLLVCANMALARLTRRLRSAFGMTFPKFEVLVQVHLAPEGPTMGELSERLLVSKGNVTDVVTRLERLGMIERRRDARDGRVQHVHLTAAGRKLVGEIVPAHDECVAGMLGGLDAKALARLYGLLGELKSGIGAEGENGANRPRARRTLRSAGP